MVERTLTLVTFGFQIVKDGFGLRGDFSVHY